MIEGVAVKELKLIPDDRGFPMEMLRCDDTLFEQFGQVYITGCREGVAKAWHYHKEQTDHFVCVAGKALVVLYDMREGTSTRGHVEEFILEAPPCRDQAPILLKIPPLVAHGFAVAEGEEARIINVPTLPYRYDNPDEYRFPWNTAEIPVEPIFKQRIDAVINFAAESHVDRSILDARAFVETNVLGTQVLLEAARRWRVERVPGDR